MQFDEKIERLERELERAKAGRDVALARLREMEVEDGKGPLNRKVLELRQIENKAVRRLLENLRAKVIDLTSPPTRSRSPTAVKSEPTSPPSLTATPNATVGCH
jgi:hypothetical protein